MLKERDLRIDQLDLDLTNYRIGMQDTQPDAIRSLIDEQGSKLTHLAEDILDHGLSPIEMLMVIPNAGNPDHFFVIEGNRRVAAIKLVLDPKLAEGTNIYSAFKKLAKRHAELQATFRCVIFPDKESGFLWIRRKHDTGLRGVGTEPWSAIAKVRADADQGKSTPIHDVLEFVLAHANLDPDVREHITGHDFPVTNLERLLSSAHVRSEFDLQPGDKHLTSTANKSWLLRILSEIVTAISRESFEGKKFTVKDIYTADQQRDFAKKLSAKYPKPSALEDMWPVEAATDLTPSRPRGLSAVPARPPLLPSLPQRRPKPRTIDRTTLIPSRCEIQPSRGRANDIYVELRKLNVETFTNATAILLRVFLEFSVEDYMSRHKIITVKPNDELKKKLRAVIDDMRNGGVMTNKELQAIEKELANPNSLISTNTLNAYVHHTTFHPIPRELKTGWDRLEPFLNKLWHG